MSKKQQDIFIPSRMQRRLEAQAQRWVFTIDAENLEANHNNYLSKHQRELLTKLRSRYRFGVWMGALGLPIIAIAVLGFAYTSGNEYAIHAYFVGFGLLGAAIWLFVNMKDKHEDLNQDLYKGDIIFIEDELMWELEWVDRINEAVYTSYSLKIGKVRFPYYTNDPVTMRGLIIGQRYRVYYFPNSRRIVSVEWIDPNKGIT